MSESGELEARMVRDLFTESNAIEGVYDGDALRDSIWAWQWLTARKNLTLSNVLKCHKVVMMTRYDLPERYHGAIRDIDVSVGGHTCPPPYLLEPLLKQWIRRANKLNDPLVDHVWFEKIHPFVDGNGRMGRLLMNWQYRKMGEPLKIFRAENKHEEYYPLFR